jgi:hypothetical protein
MDRKVEIDHAGKPRRRQQQKVCRQTFAAKEEERLSKTGEHSKADKNKNKFRVSLTQSSELIIVLIRINNSSRMIGSGWQSEIQLNPFFRILKVSMTHHLFEASAGD